MLPTTPCHVCGAFCCSQSSSFMAPMAALVQEVSTRNYVFPNCKVYGANMGPTWGRQDPGGPHVGPINLAIWVNLLRYDFCGFVQLWHRWLSIRLQYLQYVSKWRYYSLALNHQSIFSCISIKGKHPGNTRTVFVKLTLHRLNEVRRKIRGQLC